MAGRKAMATIVVVTVASLASCSASTTHGAARPPRADTLSSGTSDPAALVNPLMGTGVGGAAVGHIDDSPAADLPFGMMQWGPDTSPDRADGGGYSYADHLISGFSLTHLNGPGCSGLGDIPILPTVGSVGTDPEGATMPFSHSAEKAAPGRYDVTLGNGPVDASLAVTTRAGVASFAFPPSPHANLTFKVADSAVPASVANTEVVGNDTIVGSVTSGQFCGTVGTYTLSFAAQFDRPFTSFATWKGHTVSASARNVSGAHSGATLTFDAALHHVVGMRVGISFVSIADARANLAAEVHTWDVATVARAATSTWNSMLDRIDVGGGTNTQRRTFYSSLYRSLLHPNVFSDDNGEYPGFDHHVHTASPGPQYANFSSWDTYRSEMPLLTMIAAPQMSAMMRSLLADTEQSGSLPKLPFTDVETAEMNGDSSVPILAEAYAFGARDFDTSAALQAMLHGATDKGTGLGWDAERQDLDEYLEQGWIQVDRRDKTSFDYTIGGSETLEYAIDDSAIAQFATALGDRSTAATYATRAENWRHLVNPATHWLAARDASGRFPTGPAFQVSPLAGIGQDGWEEGNSIQYSWSVPQDLHGLIEAMGGPSVAVARLDTFFTHLNTSRKQPYDWAGNEPALGIPWVYDYASAPWRTQDVVRRIATDLYAPTPDGLPGNDDLGAMSSWYVWAAIGMYPETPGRADLALSSPFFSEVTVHLSNGRSIVVSAPGASNANRYVHSAHVTGTTTAATCGAAPARAYNCPWLPASIVATGGHVTFSLASTPDTSWGAAASAAPPSISSK
ncbi:MAG TPA: GH92 family glycosyl hydrolase [Acidimicrobiia bacterium]|jgi:predicted alpha-1,2-mannosidase